jgi:hypothetical protein
VQGVGDGLAQAGALVRAVQRLEFGFHETECMEKWFGLSRMGWDFEEKL